MVLWVHLASAASADDAPAPPEAATEEPSEEITVWGEAVQAAHQAVVDRIVGLGYDRVKSKGDRTVFTQDRGWKGKVVLYDDGRLATHRRGPTPRKMEPLPNTRFRPYVLCIVQPTACVDAGSWYLAPSKWRAIEDNVARNTASELGALGDRLADASVAEQLDALPGSFEALWTEGVPLEHPESVAPIATYQARRVALFDFWDTRTETAWGNAVRDAVASFVGGVVQVSDHPYTASECASFAERRSFAPVPWCP